MNQSLMSRGRRRSTRILLAGAAVAVAGLAAPGVGLSATYVVPDDFATIGDAIAGNPVCEDQGITNIGQLVAVDYSDVRGGWEYNGTGNIEQEPSFGNLVGFPLAADSPAIDAADPWNPAPPGGGRRMDMGWKEFIPQAPRR